MAHTLDTKLRIPATANTTTNANPITGNYTCGAGATVLVVALIYATGTRTGAPTYNGIALTQADITRYAASSPEARAELWYLLSPPIGRSLQISIPNANTLAMDVCISTYKAGAGKTSALDVANGATGTSTNPTASVTTTVNGDALISVVADGLNAFTSTGRNGTTLYTNDDGTWGGASQYLLQATAGAQAMGWTAATDDWGLVVVSFKEVTPAAISGSGGVSFGFSTAANAVLKCAAVIALAVSFAIATAAQEKFQASGNTDFAYGIAGQGQSVASGVSASGDLSYGFSGIAEGKEKFSGSVGLSYPSAIGSTGVEKLSAVSALDYGFTESLSGKEIISGIAGLDYPFAQAGAAVEKLLSAGGLGYALVIASSANEKIPAVSALAYGFTTASQGKEIFAASVNLDYPLFIGSSGIEKYSGAGELEYAFAQSGIGAERISAASGPSFGLSLDGNVKEQFSSSGNLSFDSALSAGGTERFTATGDIASAFILGGSGSAILSEPVSISGGLNYGLTLASEGKEKFSAAGGLSFAPLLNGTAKETFAAFGAVVFPPALAVASVERFTASGNCSFAVAIAGSGSTPLEQVHASGGIGFTAAVNSTGAEIFRGVGGLTYESAFEGAVKELIPITGNLAFGNSVTGNLFIDYGRVSGWGGIAYGFWLKPPALAVQIFKVVPRAYIARVPPRAYMAKVSRRTYVARATKRI